MRAYVPVSRAVLRALRESDALDASPERPVVAYAVTPALRAGQAPDADEEELEYAAFAKAAAYASSVRESARDRRVIVSVDVPEEAVTTATGSDSAALHLVASVPAAKVASVHIDEEPIEEPDEDDLADLLWHDATEVDQVLALLG